MIIKEKIKASLIHLSLSILLVALIIGSTLFFLFPKLFIDVTDFKEVASIIISVDLVLGPLLTFVVYNSQKAKKLLYIDFSVIGVIQLSALLYGAYSLYQIHPVYVAFNVDRFTIVTAKDAEPEKALIDEFKVSKFTAGKLAFAKMPTDLEKQNDLLLATTGGGEDLDKMEEYYEPIKDNISSIMVKSLKPQDLFKTETAKNKAKKFLSKQQDKINSYAFFPLNSEDKDAIIVLDKKTAQPITVINLDPWSLLADNK